MLNLTRRNSSRLGELRARAEWAFSRCPSVHRAVVFNFHEKRLRLEITLMMNGDAELMFQHDVRLAESLLNVALAPSQFVHHVAAARSHDIRRRARRNSAHYRAAPVRRASSLPGYRRPPAVLRIRRRLNRSPLPPRPALRRHRRHPVADVTRFVPTENRNVANAFALIVLRLIFARDDGFHAIDLPRFRHIDAFDTGMGIGAAQNLSPQGVRKMDVRAICRLTADLIRAFNPPDAGTDD